ncbi:MAG: right-handed parallel beta-helix repeat-containing protein [Saccharofermentanales bacterium]
MCIKKTSRFLTVFLIFSVMIVFVSCDRNENERTSNSNYSTGADNSEIEQRSETSRYFSEISGSDLSSVSDTLSGESSESIASKDVSSAAYVSETQDNTKQTLKDFGAKGDGVSDDSAAFVKAAAFDANGTYTLTEGKYRISKAFSLPQGISLKFLPGAETVIDRNITVTFNCKIEAGIYRIFSGEGKVEGSIRSPGYPQWFGASGNGTTDDTVAFNKAVACLTIMNIPYMPLGYKVSEVRLARPVIIRGTGAVQPLIKTVASTSKIFLISSSGVTITDLSFSGGSSKSSVGIYFDVTQRNIENIVLENLYATNFGSFVADSGKGVYSAASVTLHHVRADANRDIGFNLRVFAEDVVLKDVLVNNLPAGSYHAAPGIYISDAKGLQMDDVDVAGGAYDGTGGDGIRLVRCSDITADRIMVDYVNGWSLELLNCDSAYIYDYVGSLYERGGIHIKDCSNLNFIVTKANGINTSAYLAPEAAVKIENSQDIFFENLIIQYNLADALQIHDSFRVTIRNLVSRNNAGVSYKETGNSDHNQLQSAAFRSNRGSLQYIQTGTNSKIIAATLNNGSFIREVSGVSQR